MKINPILEKELKVKMRGWKSPILISIYIFVLSVVIFTVFKGRETRSDFGPQIALEVYYILAIVQFALLSMITPTLTATAISGERERQTLDLLLCTEASAFSIVWGKLTASITHVILLMIVSLPILGTIFMFGGIYPLDLILVFIYYMVMCFFLASLGIFFSTIFKKNLISIIVTYAVTLFIYLNQIVLGVFMASFLYRYDLENSFLGNIYLLINPIIGFATVLYPDHFKGIFNEHIEVICEIIPPWIFSCIFYVLLTCILIRISTYKINPLKVGIVELREIEEAEKNLKNDGIKNIEKNSKNI